MAKYYIIVCIYYILFTHSSVDEHLGYFLFLATMNNAAMNIHVQVFLQTHIFISLGYTSRSGIVGSYGNSILTFSGTAILFSKEAAPLCIPTSSVGGSQFLHIFANTCCHLSFHYSHTSGREAVSHCGFDLHFPDS